MHVWDLTYKIFNNRSNKNCTRLLSTYFHDRILIYNLDKKYTNRILESMIFFKLNSL